MDAVFGVDYMLRIHVLRATNLFGMSGKDVHMVISQVGVTGPPQLLTQSTPVRVSRHEQADILHECKKLTTSNEALQVSFTVHGRTAVVGVAKHGVLVEVLKEPVTLPLPIFHQAKEVGTLHVELQSYPIGGDREAAPLPSAPMLEQAFYGGLEPVGAPDAVGANGAPGAPVAVIFNTMLGEGVPLAKVLRGQGHEIMDPSRSLSYLKVRCGAGASSYSCLVANLQVQWDATADVWPANSILKFPVVALSE